MISSNQKRVVLATQDQNSDELVMTVCETGDISRIHDHLQRYLMKNLEIEGFARQVFACGKDSFESILIKEVYSDGYYRIYSRPVAASAVVGTGDIEAIQDPKDIKTLIYALIIEGYLSFDSFSLKRKDVKYHSMAKIAFITLSDGISDIATNDALIVDIKGYSTSGLVDYSYFETEVVDEMVQNALKTGVLDKDPRAEKQESPYNVFGHEVLINKARNKQYSGRASFKKISEIDDRSFMENSILLSKELLELLSETRGGEPFSFECRDACSLVKNEQVYNWSQNPATSEFLRGTNYHYSSGTSSTPLSKFILDIKKSKNDNLINAVELALNHYYFNVHNEGIMVQAPASIVIPISKPTEIKDENNNVLSKIHTDIKVGQILVSNAIVYKDGSEMEVSLFKISTRTATAPNSISKNYSLVVSTKTKAKSSKHKLIVIYKSNNRCSLVNKMVQILYDNCHIDSLPVVLENIKSAAVFYGQPHALNVNIGNF